MSVLRQLKMGVSKFLLPGLILAVSTPKVWASPLEDFSKFTYVVKETRLWTEPTKFGEPIAVLDPGLKIRVVSYTTTASWMRVRTPSNREGWVPVRNTSIEGNRDAPLIAGGGGEHPIGSRRPSSIENASKPPAGKAPRPDWTISGELGYVNDLSRDRASGVEVGLSIDHSLSENWIWGVGADFNFFSESESDLYAGASTSRTTQKYFPHLRLGYSSSNFSFVVGLGVDFDYTNFMTTSLSTGAEILTNSSGQYVSGGEWNVQYAAKIAPTYKFVLSPKSSLGISVIYYFIIDPNANNGYFASYGSAGTIMHILGVNASWVYSF